MCSYLPLLLSPPLPLSHSLSLFHYLSVSLSPQFLRVDQDKECNMECTGGHRKPLCASDGRTFTSRCEFLRAKCRDPQLEVIRGPCKGQVTGHASVPPCALKCSVGHSIDFWVKPGGADFFLLPSTKNVFEIHILN